MSGQAGEIKSKEILEEYGDKVKWNASSDDEIPLEVRDLVQDYFSEDE
ncbi:MAG: hypothetical protein N4A40_05145 [Tissierellales bacterium]|jgi:hypothetical protein|nr:hypothetical protein [Tissierellales bacterium]